MNEKSDKSDAPVNVDKGIDITGSKQDDTVDALHEHFSSDDDHNHSKHDSSSPAFSSQDSSKLSSLSCSPQSQKRPMNAFLIFCKRHRSVVKSRYPNLENRSITKVLGEWWAVIPADQKRIYTELARSYKEAFMKANPNFKWYKTDNKIPPLNAPNSPSASGSSQSVLQRSSGSFSIGIEKGNSGDNSSSTQQNAQSPMNISTPKPPKKRYLDFLENNDTNDKNTTDAGSSGNNPLEYLIQYDDDYLSNPNAPPILDVETMFNVIEKRFALGRNTSSRRLKLIKSSSQFNNSGVGQNVKTVRDSDESLVANELIALANASRVASGSSSGNSGSETSSNSSSPRPLEVDETESLANDDFIDNDKNCANKSVKVDTVNLAGSGDNNLTIHTCSKDESPSNSSPINLNNDNDKTSGNMNISSSSGNVESGDKSSGEKPLNLSASRVLRTSQQQIINHFIDKLLGPDSSLVSSVGRATGGLLTGKSEPTTSTPLGADNIMNINSVRKDRSCKGKRYLEMISETKLVKRPKVSQSPSGENGSESLSNQPQQQQQLQVGTSKNDKDNVASSNHDNQGENKQAQQQQSNSKWVSGGFDLEAHIAALPQLGDKHLINALNREKIKTFNGLNENNHNNNGGFNEDETNGDINICDGGRVVQRTNSFSRSINNVKIVNKIINDKDKDAIVDTHKSESSEDSNDVKTHQQNVKSTANAMIIEKSNVVAPPENFECDGLAALAEAALQQAHHDTISAPFSSG